VTARTPRRPSLAANPESIITSTRRAAAADEPAPAAPVDGGDHGGSRTRAARDATVRDPLSAHRRLVEVEARRFAAKIQKLAGPVADFVAVMESARAAGMSPQRLREILADVGADVGALRALAEDVAKQLD
jgi:hypothetical protein